MCVYLPWSFTDQYLPSSQIQLLLTIAIIAFTSLYTSSFMYSPSINKARVTSFFLFIFDVLLNFALTPAILLSTGSEFVTKLYGFHVCIIKEAVIGLLAVTLCKRNIYTTMRLKKVKRRYFHFMRKYRETKAIQSFNATILHSYLWSMQVNLMPSHSHTTSWKVL